MELGLEADPDTRSSQGTDAHDLRVGLCYDAPVGTVCTQLYMPRATFSMRLSAISARILRTVKP
ncbi:hypothetical protein H4V99_002884 [Cryobacterium sp. CG_9.6]|nr:hypothetical protein [Cryobacterium sp. CG_9.6]